MTAAGAAWLLAGLVTFFVVVCSPRFQCWVRGHDPDWPWTDAETGQRLEQCKRCGIVDEYDRPKPIGGVVEQRSIDGCALGYKTAVVPAPPKPTEPAEVSAEQLAEDDARAVKRARASAVVHERWGRVTESRETVN